MPITSHDSVISERALHTNKTPEWIVCYENEDGEECEVVVRATTLPSAVEFVEEEYGDVISIDRAKR